MVLNKLVCRFFVSTTPPVASFYKKDTKLLNIDRESYISRLLHFRNDKLNTTLPVNLPENFKPEITDSYKGSKDVGVWLNCSHQVFYFLNNSARNYATKLRWQLTFVFKEKLCAYVDAQSYLNISNRQAIFNFMKTYAIGEECYKTLENTYQQHKNNTEFDLFS